MEEQIINALGTFAFGGGGIAIVSYFAHMQFKILNERHAETLKRVCDSFDLEMDRRDKCFERIVDEIRFLRTGAYTPCNSHASGVING
jgi:hypothetical protein